MSAGFCGHLASPGFRNTCSESLGFGAKLRESFMYHRLPESGPPHVFLGHVLWTDSFLSQGVKAADEGVLGACSKVGHAGGGTPAVEMDSNFLSLV